jgi:gas vesicle protein
MSTRSGLLWQNNDSKPHEGRTMTAFRLPAFIKFLVGTFLLQGATALLFMTAQDTDLSRSGWLIGSLGILIGVIAALWFAAISSHECQHSYTRASEKFSRQRDRLRRQADKEKTREIRESQRQMLRETRRLQSRSSLKLGAALAGTAGLGVLLLFTQFMTLGLLAVSATGGALLGYGVRARQYPLAGQPAGDGTATLEADTGGRQRVIDGTRIEHTVQSTKPRT